MTFTTKNILLHSFFHCSLLLPSKRVPTALKKKRERERKVLSCFTWFFQATVEIVYKNNIFNYSHVKVENIISESIEVIGHHTCGSLIGWLCVIYFSDFLFVGSGTTRRAQVIFQLCLEHRPTPRKNSSADLLSHFICIYRKHSNY